MTVSGPSRARFLVGLRRPLPIGPDLLAAINNVRRRPKAEVSASKSSATPSRRSSARAMTAPMESGNFHSCSWNCRRARKAHAVTSERRKKEPRLRARLCAKVEDSPSRRTALRTAETSHVISSTSNKLAVIRTAAGGLHCHDATMSDTPPIIVRYNVAVIASRPKTAHQRI